MDINKMNNFVKDLMSKMTLEEKIRQLGTTSQLSIFPHEGQDLKNGIGSIWLMVEDKNPAQFIKGIQEFVIKNSKHKIPALIFCEALNGPVSIPSALQYPSSLSMGAAFNEKAIFEMADITRQQLIEHGIRWVLSPVADPARDLRFGRGAETYGNDPTLSSIMMVNFVKGMQTDDLRNGVATTGKHFIGYQSPEGGINLHKTIMTPVEMREQYAKPFEAAINLANIATIMNNYSEVFGQPAVQNRKILTDLLRNDLGFKGAVCSDFGSIEKIVNDFKLTKSSTEAALNCLKAGMDIETPNRYGFSDDFIKFAEEGNVDIKLIDTAVERVLNLKYELGLFENSIPNVEKAHKILENKENDAKSQKSTLESITLLKNDGILPIKDKKKKIAIIGPTGNTLRAMFSFYTNIGMFELTKMFGPLQERMLQNASAEGIDVQDLENAVGTMEIKPVEMSDYDKDIKALYPKTQTIKECMEELFDNVSYAQGCEIYKGDESGFEEAIKLAKSSDIVILAVGGKNGGMSAGQTSGEGIDSASLDLPFNQEKLMKEIFAANNNMVIVHTDQRPLVSEWAYENVPAIVEAWFPNVFGGWAIAQVIAGLYNPGGKTPIDVPRSVGHLPVYHYQNNASHHDLNRQAIQTNYIDSDSSVLRPFGYGLSYSKFKISDGKLNSDKFGNISITVKVQNIGDVKGDEVVQLYGSDLIASMIRPVHELVGFKRVTLEKGETKTVKFDFNIDFFSFTDLDANWMLEAGEFKFVLGAHANDKQVELHYEWKETRKINSNKRCFFAEAKIV